MSKSRKLFKHALFTSCFVLLFSLTGCSNESGPSTNSGPLPQPSVNCGGSSCID